MPLILPANTLDSSYEISNSGLFNDGQTQALTKTHGSSGSTRTFTFSCWIKFSDIKIGSSAADCCHGIFASEEEAGHQFFISTDEGILRIADYQDGSYNLHLKTNRKFRDYSAWFHFCIIFDTTNGTEGDRCKLYVNGVRETSFSTEVYPSVNTDLYGNGNQAHFIGRRGGSNTMHFDGYMADVNFIDGTAAAHTEFGEADEDSGIWKPKKYEGSYGNNGFLLEFGNTGTGVGSGRFASDTSGQGNHYDTNNFSGQYQMTDSPTNNFCTLNPLDNYYASHTFSKGNLETVSDTSAMSYVTSTFKLNKGKWYHEVKMTAGGKANLIGVTPTTTSATDDVLGGGSEEFAWYSSALYYIGGSDTSCGGSWHANTTIVSFAWDFDNRKAYIAINGTWQASQDPAAGSNGITFPAITLDSHWNIATGDYDSGATINQQWNFGNPVHSISSGNSDSAGFGNFEYAVPSGYYSLCTKNLASYG